MRAVEDVRRLLNAGADKVSINTAAGDQPELVRRMPTKFGQGDCRGGGRQAGQLPGNDRWEVFTHGGRNPPGWTRWPGRKMQQLGAGEILLTSMDRDGMKIGFNLP